MGSQEGGHEEGETGDGVETEVTQAELGEYLRQATTKGTAARKRSLYQDFVGWAEGRVSPVDALLRGLVVGEQVRMLVEYARDLYVTHGRREREVTDRLFAVRDAMNSQFLDTTCFSWDQVGTAGGAARRSVREVREQAIKGQARVKLPAPVEVADIIRAKVFERSAGNRFEDLLAQACSLAITLAMHTGNRPGSVIGTKVDQTGKDHRTLVDDIVFKGLDGTRARAGPELFAHPPGFAVTAELMAYSSKSGHHSKVALLLGGSGVHGDGALGNLVTDLEAFHRKAGHSSGEGFFTLYREGRQRTPILARKVVSQQDLRGWLKWAARELGIPEQHISLGSLRKGYATTSSMEKVPIEEVQARAGWAPGSRVTETHYDHSSHLALGERKGSVGRSLTVADVLNMVPHVSGAASSQH